MSKKFPNVINNQLLNVNDIEETEDLEISYKDSDGGSEKDSEEDSEDSINIDNTNVENELTRSIDAFIRSLSIK